MKQKIFKQGVVLFLFEVIATKCIWVS